VLIQENNKLEEIPRKNKESDKLLAILYKKLSLCIQNLNVITFYFAQTNPHANKISDPFSMIYENTKSKNIN
jgi:hypothetical protein